MSEQITKTIIKGVKTFERLVGVRYGYRQIPKLSYRKFIVESNQIIQEVNFDLIYKDSNSNNEGHGLNVLVNGKNEWVEVIKETIEDGIKTIVVNKPIETAEQRFNYDEIMKQYREELNEYWNDFMEQYKDNKPKIIEINTWLNNGMTQEEVLKELDKQYPVPTIKVDPSVYMNMIDKLPKMMPGMYYR